MTGLMTPQGSGCPPFSVVHAVMVVVGNARPRAPDCHAGFDPSSGDLRHLNFFVVILAKTGIQGLTFQS